MQIWIKEVILLLMLDYIYRYSFLYISVNSHLEFSWWRHKQKCQRFSAIFVCMSTYLMVTERDTCCHFQLNSFASFSSFRMICKNSDSHEKLTEFMWNFIMLKEWSSLKSDLLCLTELDCLSRDFPETIMMFFNACS